MTDPSLRQSWNPMADAPRDGSHLILMIGESIPDLPDIRLGQFIHGREAAEMGYPEYAPAGGWFIWNDASDWFVVGAEHPLAWVPPPVGGPFGDHGPIECDRRMGALA